MYITTPLFNHVYTVKVDFSNDNSNSFNSASVLQNTFSLHGSAAGFYAEELMAELFSAILTKAPANTRGYDLLSNLYRRPVEVKALTRNGVKLCPSSNVGAGRKADPAAFLAEAPTKDFIVVDTTKIAQGTVDFVIHGGSNIADMGANMTFTKARKVLFENDGPSVEVDHW